MSSEDSNFILESDSTLDVACEDALFKSVAASARKGCPLLDYFAPQLLAYLPYFHGALSPSEANELLLHKDDFLIFLDEHDRLIPTVVVRDCTNKPQFIQIEQTTDGCFCFQDEDKWDAFVTIHSLVVFYAKYGVPIKTKAGAEVRLGAEVQSHNYEKEFMVEEVQHFHQLSYYHKNMDAMDCGTTLLQDGDYLIWSMDKNNPEETLTLSVRWENKIEHISIKKDKNLLRYILPKENPCRPTESVAKADCYVKSLVHGRVILNGVQLLRSVSHSDRRMYGNGAFPAVDTSYSTATSVNTLREADSSIISATEMTKKAISPRLRRCALLGVKARRPLHLLPYFFGECHPSKANEYLERNGDFLVFVSTRSGRATLVVKISNETTTAWWHVPIQENSAGYFWLQTSDIRMLFTNVDELISYYHNHRQPLLAEYRQTAPELNVYLINPIIRRTDDRELVLEPCKTVEDLSYYFGKIGNEDLVELLLCDGDYLLRRDENDAILVSARWQDVLKDIYVESYECSGYYKLPARNADTFTEFAKSVDEFLKILVRNQVSLQGVILKQAVRKTSKYDSVQADEWNE
ncbi:Tyrosine-protein kinase Fps85D [Trichuris trichiura]|uniref:Tyrosine-protein kinase Fps85D n=1 Tax=Trichuris trichiura TaxID=36087 RepID=A0A077ZJF0_TRITR|nr:Tyrosine-protein kinase Fps85D [Trichuris trichiura]